MRFGRRRRVVVCGAPKKNGQPCQYKLIDRAGRCPYHGGNLRGHDLEHWKKSLESVKTGYARFLERCRAEGIQSTGPKTAEGKAKVTGNFPWARQPPREPLSAPSQPGTPEAQEGKEQTAAE
jgi:hypothetical protein